MQNKVKEAFEKIWNSRVFKENKKLLILVLSLALVTAGISIVQKSFAFAGASGTSGTCSWTIDTQGKMIIEPSSGNSCKLGAAQNNAMPWYGNREDITSVEVKEGVKANSNSNSLFYLLINATTIDVRNLDTSNVTNMVSMFYGCKNLTSLDLTNFNTSNVAAMTRMFYGCENLTSLDLTNFNTSNVGAMESMFYGCSSLTSLDLSSFNTSNVTNIRYMFEGCSNLKTIYASNKFNTNNVILSTYMFFDCTSLVGGNGTVYDSSKKDKEYARIDTAETPGYFTDPNADMVIGTSGTCKWTIKHSGKMIIEPQEGSVECTLQNQNGNLSSSPWYNNKNDITSVEVKPGVNANTNASSLFYSLSEATSIDVKNLNTSNVTDMSGMFNECSSLTSLDLSNFNTEKVTNMSYMVAICPSLTSLNVSNLNTSNVTDMSGMFTGSNSLKTIYVSNKFDTSSVTDSSEMFTSCTSLVGGNGTVYDSSKIDKEYARIDKEGTPGYFTAIETSTATKTYASDSAIKEGDGVKTGDVIKYKVAYTNKNQNSVPVTITDTLSKGLEYVTNSSTIGEPDVKRTNSDDTTTLIWYTTLDSDATGDLTYSAKVTANANNEAINTACVIIGEENICAPELKNCPAELTVTYLSDSNGTVVGEPTETKKAGQSPSGRETTPNSGYNLHGWTCDKNVTLKNGTSIPAGATLSSEQVKEVNLTEDLTFTALHILPGFKDYASDSAIKNGEVAHYGDVVKYEITYRNTSSTDSVPVTIHDTLNEGFEYVVGSSTLGEPTIVTNSDKTKTMTWNTSLAPSEEKTMTYSAKVTNNVDCNIVNEAIIIIKDIPFTPPPTTNNVDPYIVTYESDSGGTVVGTATEEKKLDENPGGRDTNPNTNYSFEGWTADKDVTLTNGTTITAGTMMTKAQVQSVKVTSNLKFTAHHISLCYTVTYLSDNNGAVLGEGTEGKCINENPSGRDTDPNDGFMLAGWTADKNVTLTNGTTITAGTMMTKATIQSVKVAENLTFTAHHVLKYTVTYLSDNYGTVIGDATETKKLNDAPSGRDTTPNSGYVLGGWTADKNVTLTNGTTITAGTMMTKATIQSVKVTENLTFTAHHVIPATKDYASDSSIKSGDKVVVGDTIKYKITYRNTSDSLVNIVIADTLSEGFEYVTGSSTLGEPTIVTNSDKTKTLTWSTTLSPSSSADMTYSAKVTSGVDCNVVNSAVVVIGGTPYTPPPIENEVRDFVVTYLSDNNGVVLGESTENKKYEQNPSGRDTDPNSGYKLKGWRSNKQVTLKDGTVIAANTLITKSQIQNVKVTSDLIFTAEHEEIKYKVTYKFIGNVIPLNADSILPAEVSYRPGETVTIAGNPTATGYKFLGWDRTESFTIVDQDVVINGTWKRFNGEFEPRITKTIPNEKNLYISGDTVDFNITISNDETYPIKNVEVTDDTATIVAGSGYTVVNEHKATIPQIAPGASVVITANYKVTAQDIDKVTNTARITNASADDYYELKPKEYKATEEFNIQNIIKIKKEVNGNLGDTKEYFKIKVIIDGNASDTYTISGQDTNITYKGSPVVTSTTYTVGQDNYIYIKSGQTATIGTGANDSKILAGKTYQVIEDGNDYKTYINSSTTDNKDSGTMIIKSNTNENSNNIHNNKENSPLTGGVFKYIPYIIIVAIVMVIGVVFILKTKLKREI